MVRLGEPKPRPRIARRIIEIAIVLGAIGVVAMNSWQAFGGKLWAHATERSDAVTVLDDCVGGLCMNGSSAEVVEVKPGGGAAK